MGLWDKRFDHQFKFDIKLTLVSDVRAYDYATCVYFYPPADSEHAKLMDIVTSLPRKYTTHFCRLHNSMMVSKNAFLK